MNTVKLSIKGKLNSKRKLDETNSLLFSLNTKVRINKKN